MRSNKTLVGRRAQNTATIKKAAASNDLIGTVELTEPTVR